MVLFCRNNKWVDSFNNDQVAKVQQMGRMVTTPLNQAFKSNFFLKNDRKKIPQFLTISASWLLLYWAHWRNSSDNLYSAQFL